MAVKRATKKTAKAAKKKRTTAKAKKGDAYECSVCGYRLVVDEVCGSSEEQVLICCGKQMKRKRAKKVA